VNQTVRPWVFRMVNAPVYFENSRRHGAPGRIHSERSLERVAR